jgi:V/A-type H+-transporting ATPase subunit I
MIVEMRRVLVFGPKRLLGGAIEEIQRVGVLHIDRIEAEEAPIATLDLDPVQAEQLNRLEVLRVRVDGLLKLLPSAPPEPMAADVGRLVPSGEGLETADLDTMDGMIAEIEGEAQALSRRRLEAEEELELVKTYESATRVLSPLLAALSGSRSLESVGFILRGNDLSVVAALRGQLRELTENRVEVVSRVVEEGKIGVVVAFLKRDAEAVRGFLTRSGISELRLPARYAAGGPVEALRVMEQRRIALPGELDGIAKALSDVARRQRARVVAIRGAIADRMARLQAVPQLAQSRYTFILHGWAPAPRVSEVRGMLRERFGSEIVVHDLPADPHHAEQVPVLLDNPPLLKPFQRLLGLFRPPRYGTLDPTIYLAIFFPIFVGIVIGDVAYGALLFLFGWWLRNKARRQQTWVVPVLGFHLAPPALSDTSWIVRIMAVWTMLFGALYLEVFGNLLEHHLGLHPIFNRVELAVPFFFLTLSLGMVQVTLGNLLHLLLALRHRHTIGVIESLALICGVVGLLVLLGTLGNYLPGSFFTPGVALIAAFLVFFLIGFALNRFAAMWLLEAISGMGNVLSYARLFGVGLAAAVLANVSNDLGGRFGPVWIGVFVGIVIQLVFFLFTLPGHLIQPARLNWVEFLTKVKYHDETGNSYRPFQKTGGD